MLQKTLLGSAAPLLMTVALGPVHASAAAGAAAPTAVAPAQSGPGQATVQEVVVTAEKRESTAQRTAATLDVVSSSVLERQRIMDVKDLNAVLPDAQIVPVIRTPTPNTSEMWIAT